MFATESQQLRENKALWKSLWPLLMFFGLLSLKLGTEPCAVTRQFLPNNRAQDVRAQRPHSLLDFWEVKTWHPSPKKHLGSSSYHTLVQAVALLICICHSNLSTNSDGLWRRPGENNWCHMRFRWVLSSPSLVLYSLSMTPGGPLGARQYRNVLGLFCI